MTEPATFTVDAVHVDMSEPKHTLASAAHCTNCDESQVTKLPIDWAAML